MRPAPALLALVLAAGALAGCRSTAPTDAADTRPATAVVGDTTDSTVATKLPDTGLALEGLDQSALRHRFGAPALSRRDGRALVLAYKFDDCVLHLFLYPRPEDGLRVRHAAAIGADRHTRPAATCRP